MLISKTPLRVSLFGGGSDYPEFIARYGSSVLGGTINKYNYITANKLSSVSKENIRLSYREVEAVNDIAEIQHPIVREYLKLIKFQEKYAFNTVADIPGRSGLGSSSSFAVGFISLMDRITDTKRSNENLAQTAIHLEREILGNLVGVQDQYHAAFGGFGKYSFTADGNSFMRCNWSKNDFEILNSSIALVSTGDFRKAKNLLKEQHRANLDYSKDTYLQKMVSITESAFNLIKDGINQDKLKSICELLDESWSLKKQLSGLISNSTIDDILKLGIKSGAYSGKLLGAGAHGFILFIGPGGNYYRMCEAFGSEKVIQISFGEFSHSISEIPHL